MLVLAIDTALEACSAAVFDTAKAAVVAGESRPMARGHAEALIPILASVMERAAVAYTALDRIAVSVGPGSFTGLRVGIAAGRGIALGIHKPAVGVTTLAALAAPYLDADPLTPVAAAIDGRHRHVYFQLFGAQGAVLMGPCMVPIDEAAHAASSASARLVGSGAALVAERWPRDAAAPKIDPRGAPDIQWVARLGAQSDPAQSPAKPLYLRAAEAHPQTAMLVQRR